MPSLFAVACFLPGRAKDLSAQLVYVMQVLPAVSQHKRMTYTNCCIYRVVPPDEQQACSKHVDFSYWNKLKINCAFCWFLLYEFFECMSENNFLKRILLHNFRFSPSYLMMLLQLQNSILFKAPGKWMCTSGKGKRREMKMIKKEKWKRRYKRRRENCSESKNDEKKCGRR